MDGEEYETEGKTCLIDNAGNIGVQGMTPAKNMSVSDGLLDVLVVRDSSMGSLLAVGGAVLGRDANPDIHQTLAGTRDHGRVRSTTDRSG